VGSPAPPDDAWTDLGGDGPQLVLTHANGFPPGTYRTTLEALLPRFKVATFAQRPLWSMQAPWELSTWRPMADDLALAVRERAEGPVVAVGHSLGGVLCALAAARNPELFSALVLLDPVIFTGVHAFSWGWMKRLGFGRRFPLVEGAARRRDTWPDRSAVRASWSGKSVFERWDARVFEDYLAAGVLDGPAGSVMLRYPKEWEARLFEICPHDEWANLRKVEVPTLVVRGANSDTLMPDAARRMAREMPDARVVELEGTSHFLPMEKPDEIARLVIDFAAGRGER
jgi:pimeloyl-ACP methyl ester carboxylesterase